MPRIDDFNEKWKCAHCGVKQLVYVGDPEDQTLPDREAFRCYNCNKIELMMPEEDFRATHGLYDDDTDKPLQVTPELIAEHAFIEDGKPMK